MKRGKDKFAFNRKRHSFVKRKSKTCDSLTASCIENGKYLNKIKCTCGEEIDPKEEINGERGYFVKHDFV